MSKAVVVPDAVHSAILRISIAESVRTGRRVTMVEVVRNALESLHGPLTEVNVRLAKVASAAGSEVEELGPLTDDKSWQLIVHAALVDGSNRAIDDLDRQFGSTSPGVKAYVNGTLSTLPVTALAYFLRAKKTPCSDLQQLIVAYECGNRS